MTSHNMRVKKVSVTFAGDDDVVQHILPISERKQSLRSTKSCLKGLKTNTEAPDTELEDETFRPSEVLVEEKDVGGTEVYGFRTPKKSGQMAMKASEIAEKVRTPKTPKTKAFCVQIEETATLTPRRSRRAKKEIIDKITSATPYKLRKRNENEYADSSSEESEGSSDDESGSDIAEEELATPISKKENLTKAPTRKRRRIPEEQPEITTNTDAYFDLHSGATLTSDRTLTRLETPRLDHGTLSQVLTGVQMKYMRERQELHAEYKALFNKWMYCLCNNFSLLFHGLGSKRQLLEEFRTTMLADMNHLVINGYFPSLTIKNVLNGITEDILDHRGGFHGLLEQCDFIREHYECGEQEDLFLIIHNIDGAMLRAEKSQNILSLLAQIRGIHVIASIDHINAPLLWDQTKTSRFNWLWWDVTTFDTYSEETSYENSLLVQQTGALALSSMQHVMHSLTPNARGIFLLLVRHQLDNADNPQYTGLAFPDLYQKCREAFLVNSDLTLRTQLTEFKDHKLIRTKKGIDGMEYLIIPIDGSTLKEFMEQQEDGS